MANEAVALARPAFPATPDHYEAFYELLSASERGRAFLAEHARRGRSADMEVLLAALTRIEGLVRASAAAPEHAVRSELQMLIMVIRNTRPQAEASPAPERAAKLAALIDLLEDRILALAGPPPAIGAASELRARLAIVPPPHEPELAIPSPAAALPSSSLATAPTPDAEPQGPAAVEKIETPPATLEPPPKAESTLFTATREPRASDAMPAVSHGQRTGVASGKLLLPASDPLAAIMMLSEDERLALFT